MKRSSHTERMPIEQAFDSLPSAFSSLLAHFVERGESKAHSRIVFVSPEHGAGTTTLTTCAALVLVRSFRVDVALIEANLYRPAMASYMGMVPSPGLLDVGDGRVPVHKAVRNSQLPGLHMLPAGSGRIPEQGEIASKKLRDLIHTTAEEHRFTLIDAPPVLEHPETCSLLENADEVILVLGAGHTRKKQAERAIQLIRDAGVPLTGAFLNRYRAHLPFGIGAG